MAQLEMCQLKVAQSLSKCQRIFWLFTFLAIGFLKAYVDEKDICTQIRSVSDIETSFYFKLCKKTIITVTVLGMR